MSGTQPGSGPLLLRVGDLLAQPGRRRAVDGRRVLADLSAAAGDIAGGAVDLQLVLEAQAGRIMVSGTVRACWELECRRCLGRLSVPVAPTITEVFETAPAEGDTFPLDGEAVDLAPMLREVVLCTLPLAPLCGLSCRGPADGAYYRPAEGAGDAEPPARRDPRWAALDGFRPEAG
ncbi:MAG: DUF177 domain-containing protein [bacterium]|nr:DUF177 domain-containing protein [bacterium]